MEPHSLMAKSLACTLNSLQLPQTRVLTLTSNLGHDNLSAFALHHSRVDLLGNNARLAADQGVVASKQARNLRDFMLGLHKARNLISLDSPEVFLINWINSTCRLSNDLKNNSIQRLNNG